MAKAPNSIVATCMEGQAKRERCKLTFGKDPSKALLLARSWQISYSNHRMLSQALVSAHIDAPTSYKARSRLSFLSRLR